MEKMQALKEIMDKLDKQGYKFLFVRKSGNSKIGYMSTCYTSKNSCPDNCPLKGNNGCYAACGMHTKPVWERVDKIVSSYDNFKKAFIGRSGKVLKTYGTFRVNTAGDIATIGTSDVNVDILKMFTLISDILGVTCYTYTHCKASAKNLKILARYNEQGKVFVNLSANTVADVKKANKYNVQATTIVPTKKVGVQNVKGIKVVNCINQLKGIQCKECKLCMSKHDYNIAFTVHGTKKNIVKTLK